MKWCIDAFMQYPLNTRGMKQTGKLHTILQQKVTRVKLHANLSENGSSKHSPILAHWLLICFFLFLL